MGDEALFISEILKGFSTGMVQGMETRRKREDTLADRELQVRELDIKERALMDQKTLDEVKYGLDAYKASITELKTKADISDAETKRKLDAQAQEMLGEHRDREHLWKIEKANFEHEINMLKAGTEASKAKETARHNKAMEDLTSKYQKGMIEARGKPRPLSPEEANLKKAQAAKIWSQIGRNKAGERLSPVMMRGIVEMAKLPSLLKEIEKGIVGVKDKFGPVWGGIAKRNPWDNAAQIYTKDVNMFAETLVKAIQGSRPSDYDAKRYMALAPQLDATYEVAADRLKKLRQAFEYEQALTYHILKAQGFNMAGVPKPKNVVDPLTGATPMSVAAKMDMTFATHSGGTDKKNMTREQKIQLLKKLEAEKQK